MQDTNIFSRKTIFRGKSSIKAHRVLPLLMADPYSNPSILYGPTSTTSSDSMNTEPWIIPGNYKVIIPKQSKLVLGVKW